MWLLFMFVGGVVGLVAVWFVLVWSIVVLYTVGLYIKMCLYLCR